MTPRPCSTPPHNTFQLSIVFQLVPRPHSRFQASSARVGSAWRRAISGRLRHAYRASSAMWSSAPVSRSSARIGSCYSTGTVRMKSRQVSNT